MQPVDCLLVTVTFWFPVRSAISLVVRRRADSPRFEKALITSEELLAFLIF